MSPDVQNMMAGFGSLFPQQAPSVYPNTPTFPTGTYAPGTYQYPSSPFPNNYVPPDYGKTFSAIARSGAAIGAVGRDIGGYRSEKAMGSVAQRLARADAFRIANQGLKAASTARAVTGAQGTTGAGSPLLAELESIQNAQTDARKRLYEGNIEKYYADQRAKRYLHKAPADALTALLEGSELFKEIK